VQLQAILDDPSRRDAFVRDSVTLIDHQVASRRGLSGAAVKAGFKSVRALRPGVVSDLVRMLLPSFAPAIEPHVAAAQQTGAIDAYFSTHATDVARDMLAVTDAKAQQANNALLRKVYKGLRGQAERHTVDAMPEVGKLLAKHIQ